jgi:hypothetical protein
MCKSCGKQVHSYLSSGFGILARAGTLSSAPVAPRAARLELSCPRAAAMCQRGIVSDWRVRGKRKIGEGVHQLSHTMHSFSTSTSFVEPRRLMGISAAFVNIFLCETETARINRVSWPEENSAYFRFFLSGLSNS